ncbi:hypothetical protein B6S12_09825, partial [Helicobacter valdiviensis]
MKGVIFKKKELDFWKKFYTRHQEDALNFTKYDSDKEAWLKEMHKTITSYKQSSSNGIIWSKEEKELFKTLSLKEQRKMIVKKSELKSVLFPYVNVDYKAYEYSTRSQTSGIKEFKKAKDLLDKNPTHIANLDFKLSEDILHFLKIAYKSGNLEAGYYYAKLLFERATQTNHKDSLKELFLSVSIVKELKQYNIPEVAYLYYAMYKWSIGAKLIHQDIGSSQLSLIREEAKDCYSYALECVVWEAIDEEAQRNDRDLLGAELYLAAAIKYQSPIAFLKAAQFYAPSGLTREVLNYALIPYNASLRCSIALGSKEALETLISNYEYGTRMMRKNPLQAQLLKTHQEKRELINGLDPFFDEKFKPEYIIDYGSFLTSFGYGGTIVYPGISRLVSQGRIKDPRDSDSTKESIKEFYLKVWEML